MPLMPNTVSVMTAPESMLEICRAIMVTTGSMLFFRAWWRMMPALLRPLARAVLM